MGSQARAQADEEEPIAVHPEKPIAEKRLPSIPTPVFKSVLVIDDTRTMRFDCAYARTVAAAISLLPDGWDETWFDFDLARGESVEPVVEWILKEVAAGTPPELGVVFVHSSNESGARWVEAQLGEHYAVRRVRGDLLRRNLRKTRIEL